MTLKPIVRAVGYNINNHYIIIIIACAIHECEIALRIFRILLNERLSRTQRTGYHTVMTHVGL